MNDLHNCTYNIKKNEMLPHMNFTNKFDQRLMSALERKSKIKLCIDCTF